MPFHTKEEHFAIVGPKYDQPILFSSELCTDTVCSASECVIPLNDLAEIYNIQNHGRSVRQVVHAMAKNKFCSLRVTDNQCYRLSKF